MKRLLILAALMTGFSATGLSETASAYCPPYCAGGHFACGCYAFYNYYPNYTLCRGRYCPGAYYGPSVIIPTTGGQGYGSATGLYSGNGMYSGRDVGAWGR
jgi:hypothetical protein